MKRIAIFMGLACLGFLLPAREAGAQQTVEIFLKSKKAPIKNGAITKESAEGIKLLGVAEIVPAEDIEDVDYTYWIPPAQLVARKPYMEAVKAEKEAAKSTGAMREDNLNKAIAGYKEALEVLPKELLYPRQHAEFKVAYLTGVVGQGGKQLFRQQGIEKLANFKKNNADTWQNIATLLMLIKLYAEEKKFTEMRDAVKELSASPNVSPKMKGETKMLVVRLIMDEGDALLEKKDIAKGKEKYIEAQKEVEGLMPELPKDSPARLNAVLILSQCKAVVGDAKQKQEAMSDLEKLLKETTDKGMKAAVYNQLGELYFKDGRIQDARWQFLWVDVIYNQDKEQHARALYWLWKIFNQLGESERAQDFFETLTNPANPSFKGSYYQDKAVKENAASS